jgi:hypothetical protein
MKHGEGGLSPRLPLPSPLWGGSSREARRGGGGATILAADPDPALLTGPRLLL